eukprot:1391970-Amorphochlora_amoeboformis.AAC.1
MLHDASKSDVRRTDTIATIGIPTRHRTRFEPSTTWTTSTTSTTCRTCACSEPRVKKDDVFPSMPYKTLVLPNKPCH